MSGIRAVCLISCAQIDVSHPEVQGRRDAGRTASMQSKSLSEIPRLEELYFSCPCIGAARWIEMVGGLTDACARKAKSIHDMK